MKEEIELTKKYLEGTYEDNHSNYHKLKTFFQSEISKLPFIELEFSSYRKCYEELSIIFNSNRLIQNYCRNILNYKNKELHSLNEKWDLEKKGDYEYKNNLPTQEIHVTHKTNKYFLRYRILDLEKLVRQQTRGELK